MAHAFDEIDVENPSANIQLDEGELNRSDRESLP
jgi:hypothetical protein